MHHQDELREGLGSGVSATNRHVHALLDRAAFERPAAMARQGAHADGLAAFTLFLDVIRLYALLLRGQEK